ncbi:unnamed protein product [Scytosiphon promiscuus]
MTSAIICGHHHLVQQLVVVHGEEILRRGGGGGDHIRLAARLGRAPMVSLLLEHGVDVRQRSTAEEWESALDLAAVGGSTDIISMIARRGGPDIVNATSERTGFSALHHAAKHDEEGSIVALVEGGARLELEDDEGFTPLHVAAAFDSEAAIRALIRHGAEVEAVTNDNLTPVMLAIKEGHEGAVGTLIAAGADIHSQGGTQSGLEHAVWSAARAVDSEEGDYIPHDAMEKGISLVRTLLRHGARAGDASHGGRTALHTAGWLDLAPVIDILVEAGADVDAKTEEGDKTPLFIACKNAGNVSAINALVRHGADIHAREAPSGNTPLHAAAKNGVFEGSPATVDALLKAGADETMLNAAGLTPAHLVQDADETDEAYPDIEAVRSLLVNAPRDRADRAWGRRALFVLCRAFPDRVLLTPRENGGHKRSRSPAVDDAAAPDPATTPAKRQNEAAHVSRNIEETLVSGIGGSACDFGTAMHRLMSLQQDCIFREIIGYL